jgi:hypothetical protein
MANHAVQILFVKQDSVILRQKYGTVEVQKANTAESAYTRNGQCCTLHMQYKILSIPD